jgi:hypothetical protein
MDFRSVSWEDCTCGVSADGALSCFGPNIADVRLKQQDGSPVYVLRPDNWNELLAFVTARQVAVVVGQEAPAAEKKMESITLERYLSNVGSYAHYAGAPAGTSLYAPALDDKIGLRIQCVFVAEDSHITANVYSYGTRSAIDPQNALLYCTTQGASLQTPGSGGTDLFLLTAMPDGKTRASWLKTATSEFAVGAQQTETAETIAKATAAGHAVAMKIGIEALGDACNTVVLVQVPLKQHPRPVRDRDGYEGAKCSSVGASAGSFGGYKGVQLEEIDDPYAFAAPVKGLRCLRRAAQEGPCKAARVSMGATHTDDWRPIKHSNWERHPGQHITVTITRYWTVPKGCVPSKADALAAVQEIKALYGKLANTGRLADKGVQEGVVDSKPPIYSYAASAPFPQ